MNENAAIAAIAAAWAFRDIWRLTLTHRATQASAERKAARERAENTLTAGEKP